MSLAERPAHDHPAPLWSMTLFSDLRVEREGDRLTTFRTRKAAELLAMLALRLGQALSRDSLVELLWPERDPRASLRQLRVELSSLRTRLEPPGVPRGQVLITNHSTIRLNPHVVSTDVARFERALNLSRQAQAQPEQIVYLQQAVELYRGELLPHLYSDWIEGERRRLAESYSEALVQLAHRLAALGQRSAARELAYRAVAADPLHEEAHAVLMQLYAADGRPSAARLLYMRFEARVQAEFGVPPSDQLRSLAEQL